ncbi:MAG: magnesium transporter [Myxococcaceae bacterium]
MEFQSFEDRFLAMSPEEQRDYLHQLPVSQKRSWLRLLAPDDAADLIQVLPPEEHHAYLDLIDDATRLEIIALMAYAEDKAGGLMSSRYARLRPEMSVDEAVRYLRIQARTEVETIYYAYVLDPEQHLLGVLSFRELLVAPPEKLVKDIMRTQMITVPEHAEQEAVGRLFANRDLLAMPVVDEEHHMKGIVTFDDIVHVVQEEATEDIQKLGGISALDSPYLRTRLWEMLKKRAGWLTVLFLGELFTATAMGFFEKEIEKAVVLALFIPLIISSGGNAGSQATTLIIRSMALGEVKLKDWWRVLGRELQCGLMLGAILGSIGLMRILLWSTQSQIYGPHYMLVAWTVALSLVGVVLWGAVMGSMLPFVLKRFGFDPAASSAPFVATMVDVTGLVIYFSIASLVLSGTLL